MVKQEDNSSWDKIKTALVQWHRSHDGRANREEFAFLETELRLMIPALVWRTWTEDLIQDALRSFLVKLLEKPLPEPTDNLRAYLATALKRHCIDLYEARRGRRTTSIEDMPQGWEPPASSSESPLEIAEQRELSEKRTEKLRSALLTLSVEDRIALKLAHAPERLDAAEIQWLSVRANMDTKEVRRLIQSTDDIYPLTHVFDPGDEPLDDPAVRRKRMERFRKRRSRACAQLREILPSREDL